MMEVYVTKYALSIGILKVPADSCTVCPGDVVQNVANGHHRFHMLYHGQGNEWHMTFESAKAKAESMRDKKITSLEKQIAKLKAMTFDEVKG